MGAAAAERGTEFGKPRERRYHADAGYGAAGDAARQKLGERRNALDEKIAVVETGPGRDDEHQTGFEEIRSEQQSGDEGDGQPPDWLPASRSARSRTSR
jgi:hypothetical protein